MTSMFVAAVSNSYCSCATFELNTLNGISEKIAIPRPHAVAISASPMPPVTATTDNSALPTLRKARISPVTVPSRPRSGASVTSVSITFRNRPARLSSLPAASWRAPGIANPPKSAFAHDGDGHQSGNKDRPHDRSAFVEELENDVCEHKGWIDVSWFRDTQPACS